MEQTLFESIMTHDDTLYLLHENYELFDNARNVVLSRLDDVKKYVIENIEDFIDPTSIVNTYNNIKSFSSSVISNTCHELTA
jgi:hypothetical protein